VLVACVNLFNDVFFLPACLKHLEHVVDKIIVVDGAYQRYLDYFKNLKPWSTDGSVEVCKVLPLECELEIVEAPAEGWRNQVVKRNVFFRYLEEGDWFLVIDADELLFGDAKSAFEEIMNSGCIAGSFPLVNLGLEEKLQYYWHPRFFRYEKGMHYELTHWHLRDRYGRVIEVSYPIWHTDKALIVHLKYFKTVARRRPHEEYMRWMSMRGWIEP